MKAANTRRSARLGDQILRELAGMLEEFQDPRLELVTFTGVRMNKDLRIAEVFFTTAAGEERRKEAQAGLEKAAGRMRAALGRNLQLRYLPELRFVHDSFLEDMVYGQPHPGHLPDSQE